MATAEEETPARGIRGMDRGDARDALAAVEGYLENNNPTLPETARVVKHIARLVVMLCRRQLGQ